MQTLLRAGILITSGILIIGIVNGCTPDDEYEDNDFERCTYPLHPEEEYGGPPPATEVVVDPRPGATIPSDTPFNLKFDQRVTWASVNGAAAIGSGYNWSASLPLSEGAAFLNVSWENRDGSRGGQAVGPYVVRDPDITRPVIVGGTVRDSEWNIDPAQVNAVGFRLDFNEPVAGTIKLTDEAGNSLNWIDDVVDWTATLTPVAGQELVNETIYKIEVDVADAAGNRLRTTITFVTKSK